jgi:hypothetical protein
MVATKQVKFSTKDVYVGIKTSCKLWEIAGKGGFKVSHFTGSYAFIIVPYLHDNPIRVHIFDLAYIESKD